MKKTSHFLVSSWAINTSVILSNLIIFLILAIITSDISPFMKLLKSTNSLSITIYFISLKYGIETKHRSIN